MSIHKAKPKLKKYKLAGLTKKRDIDNSRINFFLPEQIYLSNYLKKLEHTFSNSLNNRRRIKLLFGFNQTYKLLNFIQEIERKNKTERRFSKPNGFANLLEHRLDIVLFRSNFASTLSQARQFISHRQIFINGVAITSSFFILKKGDIISISPTLKKIIKLNIKQSIQKKGLFVTQSNLFEVNFTIQKIIIVSENLKTNEFFSLDKKDLNSTFTKCLKA
jgi:ribosomal protein S4